MTREPQELERPRADLDFHQNQDFKPKFVRSPSAPPEPRHQNAVFHQPNAFEQASGSPCGSKPSADRSQSSPLRTEDHPRLSYHQQPVHLNNTLRGDAALSTVSQACPPAGNTVYALDSRVTRTHHLFVNPPLLPPQVRLKYLNFPQLVGDPGARNGTQNKPLEDFRQVPEGHWSRPGSLGDGVPIWEAADRVWTNNIQRRQARPVQPERISTTNESKNPSKSATAAFRKNEEQDEEGEEPEEAEEPSYKQPKRRRGKRTSAPSKKLQDEQSVKRVKNKRIERPFLIGSEAWPLDETNTRKTDTPEEHTKGWRVYVKAPPGQPEITTWLRKVQFKIFHTYANPTRMVDEPPFQIEETGWGGFTVEVKLFFVQEVGARPQDRSHFLQLEPYGTEAEQEKQKREKMVRSELLDYVEFNEPTETMFDILTSEDQFKAGKAGKGKGKSKLKREDGEEATVALPETSSASNQYSKELEQQLLDILKKAERQVDEQLETEVKKGKALEAQLKELQPAGATGAASATPTTK